MASILLASGTTAADSADLVIADGARKTLKLTGDGQIVVQYKRQDATYRSYVTMGKVNHLVQLSGPITVRASRPVQATACGVDEE